MRTGALVAVVYLFNRGALGIFLPDDGAAIAIAQHLNAIVVWSFLFFGLSFVLFGVVRATGAVMPPLIILTVALWFVRVPFAWLLRGRLGADAVWWSFPARLAGGGTAGGGVLPLGRLAPCQHARSRRTAGGEHRAGRAGHATAAAGTRRVGSHGVRHERRGFGCALRPPLHGSRHRTGFTGR
jgi:hypothetical protein